MLEGFLTLHKTMGYDYSSTKGSKFANKGRLGVKLGLSVVM